MLLQRRDASAPRLSRTAARLPKALDPDNRRAGTDIKLLGRRAPRRPAFNFRKHSRPHVFRIGLWHRPASQNRINADRLSHPSPPENPLDSIGTEHALANCTRPRPRLVCRDGQIVGDAVVNRMLAGYRGLMARGEFVEPKAGRVIRAKVNAKSEPELTFFHSYFLFEPGATVPTWLLWPAWEFWCRKMGQARLLESISTASQLSRALNEKVGGWTGAQGPR